MMQGFQKVARLEEVERGQGLRVPFGKSWLALFHTEEGVFAVDDACPHRGESLAESDICGRVITCIWHGAEFDLTDGAIVTPPAAHPIRSYEVKVSDGWVYVAI